MRSGFALDWLQSPQPLVTEQDVFPPLPAAGDVAVQVLRPSSQPGWNDAALVVEALLHLARDRVRIATPYSRLPDRFLRQLTSVARRGVQVQLLVPGAHVDHRVVHLQGQYQYQSLLDAGVEIWRYQPSMYHVKAVTVDGGLAMVGTTNVDSRSLALNEQAVLVVADTATTSILDGHYDDDLAHSARIDRATWRQRGAAARAVEVAAQGAGRPLRGLGASRLTRARG